MLIRDAELADRASVMSLYRQLQPNDPVLPDGIASERYAQILAADWLHLLVAEVDQAVRGTCYLNVIPNLTRGARSYAVIENVVTEAASRSRGIGQALMGAALDRAWHAGCYKVMLQTGRRRPETHQFYRRCGFSADDKQAFIAWRPDWQKP